MVERERERNHRAFPRSPAAHRPHSVNLHSHKPPRFAFSPVDLRRLPRSNLLGNSIREPRDRIGTVQAKWVEKVMKNTNSLFISNFPDEWEAFDVREILGRYWPVTDVFMPKKRNKIGKKFAFARFANTRNLTEILEEVKGLWIGNYKILANIARFDRNEGEKIHVAKFRIGEEQARRRQEGVSYLQAANAQENNEHDSKTAESSKGREEGEIAAEDVKNEKEGTKDEHQETLINNYHKEILFFPEKESVAWVNQSLIYGLKEGVNAADVVDLLQSREYYNTSVIQVSHDLWALINSSKEDQEKIMNRTNIGWTYVSSLLENGRSLILTEEERSGSRCMEPPYTHGVHNFSQR